MPWKLIFFVLLLAFVLAFIGFNLENACNVSFGVYTFEKVPVFMSILGAFALGAFVMLPFCIGCGRKKKRTDGTAGQPKNKGSVSSAKASSESEQNSSASPVNTPSSPLQSPAPLSHKYD